MPKIEKMINGINKLSEDIVKVLLRMPLHNDPHNFIVQSNELIDLYQEIGSDSFSAFSRYRGIEFILIYSNYFLI
jgi:hypothetical protein